MGRRPHGHPAGGCRISEQEIAPPTRRRCPPRGPPIARRGYHVAETTRSGDADPAIPALSASQSLDIPTEPANAYGGGVPPKIRDLIADLRAAGFVDRGGRGSHRNFIHPKVRRRVTISGALGDDAKYYQIDAVQRAIEESKA